MPASGPFTLDKTERVTGRTLVETLFKGGESRSMSYYPLRVVYRLISRDKAPVRILVSVPKKCFKRAVKRNRVKRQLREAYRHNKQLLWQRLADKPGQRLLIAFIWTDNQLHSRFVDMVASEWARDGIATREQALLQTKKQPSYKSSGRRVTIDAPDYIIRQMNNELPQETKASREDIEKIKELQAKMKD